MKNQGVCVSGPLEWVAWSSIHRLPAPIGHIPHEEAEAKYSRQLASQATTVAA